MAKAKKNEYLTKHIVTPSGITVSRWASDKEMLMQIA